MKYLPTNTLAYYNAAPQFKRYGLRDMPVSVFAAATKSYRAECALVSPDHDAVNFYALNHCASILRKLYTPNMVLPPFAQNIMEDYVKLVGEQGQRMLHYILSICPREMRHLHQNNQPSSLYVNVKSMFGQEMVDYLEKLTTYDEDDAVDFYMAYPPVVKLGEYINTMAWVFDKGSWNHSYGGKKWGNVAHAAESFIEGKFSLEMLIDTGYTLAHNGGPVFDKGMMYHGHSGNFMKLLDVQRSGQVPELVLDGYDWGVDIPDLAKSCVTLMHTNLPGVFKEWVDWGLVEKLGAMKSYGFEKEKQAKLHKKEAPAPVKKTEPAAKVIKPPIKIGAAAAKEIGEFVVFPGQVVKVYKRVGV